MERSPATNLESADWGTPVAWLMAYRDELLRSIALQSVASSLFVVIAVFFEVVL